MLQNTTCITRQACISIGCVICLSVFFFGCASPIKTVRMKIHSEPEGAYIVYKLSGPKAPCAGDWIYLGNTPFRGVHQFDKEQFDDVSKITFKVMHRGYSDQVIEWDGPGFWEEAEEKGLIFWTPELIPEPQQQ